MNAPSLPMVRTCAVTGEPFSISATEAELRALVAPHIGGRAFPWPAPQLSPVERQRRRLAFRNERVLYRTKSALSGKSIISSYSPDKEVKVLTRDEWLAIDNTQFGREFDFDRPFFDQFAELLAETYKPNVIQDGEMINCEYCHFSGWSKNCYLTFDSGKNEDCSYGALFIHCKDSLDCFYAVDCELCYDCVKVHNCYELLHSQFCTNCSFSAYLTDCIGCKSCICCANLRNKEYYAFNRPVGKAEFERLRKEHFTGSYRKSRELATRYESFLQSVPRRALRNTNCGDVSGDLLTSCVNVFDSYNISNSKDCFHCHDCIDLVESLDISMFAEGMQRCYELSGCGGARGKVESSNCACSCYIFYGGWNIFYSVGCHNSSRELFGCSELNHREYCILNKQYTPTQYSSMVGRIVEHMERTGEWGEFFPMSMSPYGYNESLAQEFLPLAKHEAVAKGAWWSEYRAPTTSARSSVLADELEDLFGSGDELPAECGIICSVTGRPFRLIPKEREFALARGLPLPRLHPEERQRLRSRRFNPRKLHLTTCARTGREIETTYAPSECANVYSEAAYLDEVL